jgi:hypothetical protein
MKVTLLQVQNAKECLTRLANMTLPIKTAYSLSKVIKELNDEYISIEEFRVTLIKRHGVEAEDGNISVPPNTPAFESFMQSFSEFMVTEVEIHSAPIQIDVTIPGLSVTPLDLLNSDPFIEFVGLDASNDGNCVENIEQLQ